MNKVMLVGRLVDNARPIKNGSVFTLATQGLTTKFIPCVTFNDKLTSYLAKGRSVSIEGHLDATKKDGKLRVVIIADELTLLDAKKVVNNSTKFEDKVLEGEKSEVPAFLN